MHCAFYYLSTSTKQTHMKKMIAAAMLLLALNAHAQSEELYTYITKSMKDDINNGRDFKQAYTFTKWNDAPSTKHLYGKFYVDDRAEYFKCYAKENPDSLICLVLVIKINRTDKCKDVFCIPRVEADRKISSKCILDLLTYNCSGTELYWDTIRYLFKYIK